VNAYRTVGWGGPVTGVADPDIFVSGSSSELYKICLKPYSCESKIINVNALHHVDAAPASGRKNLLKPYSSVFDVPFLILCLFFSFYIGKRVWDIQADSNT
jgi:hypothetical protein